MRCRNCGAHRADRAVLRLPGLFRAARGGLRLRRRRGTLTRDAIASRAPGIWRYAELLPVDAPPARSLPVGSTPLSPADRLAPDPRRRAPVDQGRHAQPFAVSFKDRAVAVAAARAVEFGVEALACASTGNLAGATAAAAAAVGLPAFVFIPADLEPAKVDHALAYGATVVPIDGTYDDVNRLCLEVADETGWGFVNVNLRPFYAEGSKTLAFEIAEALGWRSPGRHRRARSHRVRCSRGCPRVRGARRTRTDRAPTDPVRRRPGRRLRPGRDGLLERDTDVIEPIREPDPSSARWRSATRPTVATRSSSPAIGRLDRGDRGLVTAAHP